MADLNAVFEAIGGLKSSVDSILQEQTQARHRDEKVFSKLEDLGTKSVLVVEKHEHLTERVAKMEPHVESYKNVRQRAIALWAASVFAAGVLPPFIKAWLGKGS